MTNITETRAPKTTGTKNKPGYLVQPVPANEKTPGASNTDLGQRWGLDPGKSNPLGRTTRSKKIRPLPIKVPGGLEPAQDEPEAGNESLDQSGKPDGDCQGHCPLTFNTLPDQTGRRYGHVYVDTSTK